LHRLVDADVPNTKSIESNQFVLQRNIIKHEPHHHAVENYCEGIEKHVKSSKLVVHNQVVFLGANDAIVSKHSFIHVMVCHICDNADGIE